eukprot:10111338-Alexandrium_andersonii.AAC.1
MPFARSFAVGGGGGSDGLGGFRAGGVPGFSASLAVLVGGGVGEVFSGFVGAGVGWGCGSARRALRCALL